MKKASVLLFTLCLLATMLAFTSFAQDREVLIKNATIMTAAKGTIEGGSILIRNGKIVAVDKADKVTASPSAKVIDGTGMYVTPDRKSVV